MFGTYKVIEDQDGQIRAGLAISLPVRIGQRLLWRGEASSTEDALRKCRQLVRFADTQLSLFPTGNEL